MLRRLRPHTHDWRLDYRDPARLVCWCPCEASVVVHVLDQATRRIRVEVPPTQHTFTQHDAELVVGLVHGHLARLGTPPAAPRRT